jgi:hypothetical protein
MVRYVIATGRCKAVLLAHRNPVANGLAVLPIVHSYGLVHGVCAWPFVDESATRKAVSACSCPTSLNTGYHGEIKLLGIMG